MAAPLSSRADELTTTSYAVLGLLAIRRWSTYELAVQMRRNLHHFWPRAESNLYAEAKRLAAGGYARAESEPVGRRRRTVYSITPAGRRALEAWASKPAASPPRLESEALVKLMFADHGDKATLLETLAVFRDQATARDRELQSIFAEYLRGEDPFPERVHINVVAYRLLAAHASADAAWAKWAIREVERWSDTQEPQSRRRALAQLRPLVSSRSSGSAAAR